MRIIFFMALFTFFLNSCQTFDAGVGPGNSPNSFLVIVNRGIVEIKVYSEIIDHRSSIDDNNRTPPKDGWGVILGLLEATREEPEPIELSAGSQFSYHLRRNERATVRIRRINDGGNDGVPEVLIRYHGRERKFNVRNVISRSFMHV